MADAPRPTSAGVFGIARTTGRPGAAASSVAIVTPAAIESTSVSRGKAGSATSSVLPTSPGFTATMTTSVSATAHAPLGTTRTLGNCASSSWRRVGIDLGDRDVLGVVPAVEQAARAAPRPSSRHRAARREPSAEGNRRRTSPHHMADCGARPPTRHLTAWCVGRGRDEARGTIGTASHFPERSGPPAPRASRWRHRTTVDPHSSRHFSTI